MEIKNKQFIIQALLLIAIAASIVIHGILSLSPTARYALDANIFIRPPSSSISAMLPADTALLANSSSLPLRVITHNIRYDASVFSRFPHEPPWSPTRLNLFTSQMRLLTRLHFTPLHTVVFLQEALHNQFRDVADQSLGADWAALGVGRDDGKEKGEHEAVYYRKQAWKRVHWETRWLNEDGSVGKKGWDASSVRTVTCVLLDAVTPGTKKRVLFLNAHLDDVGKVARRESAKLLLEIVEELRAKWEPDYWVVGGDFNSGKDDDAYETMVEKSTNLLDVGTIGSDAAQWGDFATYTGFDGKGERHPKDVDRIDFLFIPSSTATESEAALKPDLGATERKDVEGYAVIPNMFEGSKLGRVSDHRAVVVDLLV